MPELPDITLYLEALERRVLGQRLERVRVTNPFLLRSAVPPIHRIEGRNVTALRRLGKRIVLGFAGDLWLVLHLMIAGRLHWMATHPAEFADHRLPAKSKRRQPSLAALIFPNGTLTLTEAGTKRRAALHLVEGEAALRAHDPGGLEVVDCRLEDFARTLTRENHALKRALTDPGLFSGVGNACSDEILHHARLSPVALTQRLAPDEIERLHRAVRETLAEWIELLRRQTGDGFPENVTAFRPEMAVHGKFRQPCPVCGVTVQRIRHADNETNYCPGCQTGGRLLADRSLSLLLKQDWPKTPEEMEERRGATR